MDTKRHELLLLERAADKIEAWARPPDAPRGNT